jgi:hypothetical protein
LARVREELLRKEEPPHHETLVGMVKPLARDDESLETGDSGSVVISAEVNGRKRNVHMTLSGEAHAQAIECYRQRLPLIVTGDPVFERQAWRLVGNVEVGPSIATRTAPKIDKERCAWRGSGGRRRGRGEGRIARRAGAGGGRQDGREHGAADVDDRAGAIQWQGRDRGGLEPAVRFAIAAVNRLACSGWRDSQLKNGSP